MPVTLLTPPRGTCCPLATPPTPPMHSPVVRARHRWHRSPHSPTVALLGAASAGWERVLRIPAPDFFSVEAAMRSSAVLVVAALVLTACQDAPNPTQPRSDAFAAPAAGQPVPGQYIVVFQDAVADPAGLAQKLVAARGGSLLHTYAHALKGFAARLPAAAVEALRHNPQVAYVEPDQIVRADGTESMDANGDPWGLDRIDQSALPLSQTYTYTSTGAGVHAYIIDTGIWTLHPDFGGRANNVYDAYGATGEDCHGHGTHVSGTIGGATYGVAKAVSLHGVRVL